MKRVLREFIADDKRNYKVRLGRHGASALSGFVAGAIGASIIWWAVATNLYPPSF